MLRNTVFSCICISVLLCTFYIRGRRYTTKYVPRVLINESFVSHDFPDSYTYIYTNPSTGAHGEAMSFEDEKALKHIRQVESIIPVNAEEYVSSVPQVVTYSSENHWPQTDSHLPTILKQFENVVVYSMGLRPETIANATDKYKEKITFIKFDPTEYPPHVGNFKVYAFKGVIWADAIVRFGWCLFLDASVFLTGDVMGGLRESFFNTKNDTCFKYVIADAAHDIFMATRVNLYNYFPVDQDEFESLHEYRDVAQQQSGGFSVLPTKQCLLSFVKPVLMCSLYKDCIALPGATLTGKTRHRYDQSIAHTLVGNMYGFQNMKDLKTGLTSPKEYITLRQNLAAIVCRHAYGCPTETTREQCGERNGTIPKGILKQYCV